MKRMKKSLYALLFSCALLAGSMPVAAETNTADPDLVTTKAETTGSTVDLTVDVKDDTKLTSGRVIVFYDADALTLEEATTGGDWDLVDVNENYQEGNKKGVAIAWAAAEDVSDGSETAVITFQAKESAVGKEVIFTTVADELFKKDTALAVDELQPIVTPVKITSSADPGPADPKPADPKPETPTSPSQEPGETNSNQTATVVTTAAVSQNVVSNSQTAGVDTGDHANFANAIFLIALGGVVLAYAVRKQMKTAQKEK